MRKRFWIRRGLAAFAFGLGLLALVGLVVMALWNWLVPVLFAGPTVTFWQALGLLALGRILFGGFGFGGRRRGFGKPNGWNYQYVSMGGGSERHGEMREKMRERAEKWRSMTPEERRKARDEMRAEWRERCNRGWRDTDWDSPRERRDTPEGS